MPAAMSRVVTNIEMSDRIDTDPAAEPVFDPFDPLWASDPFPLYADLRERAPIHRNDLGFWVVARHADCLAVLRDRRASSDSLNVAVDADAPSLPHADRRRTTRWRRPCSRCARFCFATPRTTPA